MTKAINLRFDNEDFEKLKEKKGKLSWEKFVLMVAGVKNETNTRT